MCRNHGNSNVMQPLVLNMFLRRKRLHVSSCRVTDVEHFDPRAILATRYSYLNCYNCIPPLIFIFQLQGKAFEFGKNLAFAHQLKEDFQTLREQRSPVVPYSASVILSCRQAEAKTLLNQIFTEKDKERLDSYYFKLAEVIMDGDVIFRLKELCLSYANRALKSLNLFPASEAKDALINIANSCTIQE